MSVHLDQYDPPRVLEVVDLEFGYGTGAPVIRGCRLEAHRGEVHCVLGCSGGGKTTLLRLIAGLERARAGRIVVDGTEVEGPGVHVPPERRPVGMVFQDYALFPNRSVLRNVSFGLRDRPRRERREQAERHLEHVGMIDFADRMPHTLSGGQQQRVAIARALARRPRVMLLDEPFSSLDHETREEVRDQTIEILREADVATVMVTHDPGEAEKIGGRISWLAACCQDGGGGGRPPENCDRG